MMRILPVLILALALALPRAGSYLVVDHPSPSDTIVVLAGDPGETRVNRGLQALRTGLGRELFIDADNRSLIFGRTLAQIAQSYIQGLPPEQAARIHVCPLTAKSTVAESAEVAQCLAPLRPHQVLIVTSDYHSRRALSVFQRRLPQYGWSVTTSHDETEFRQDYWNNREWLKTTLLEWEKLAYWELVERWRSPGARLAASAR
jgi:uncharacterized SAM-binding protein YcdF (DUF218 family)